MTLHARTVSARRRRQGAADLSEVKTLKEALRVPVISNGNVRVYSDIGDNLAYTLADGVMVGETLLGNPWYVLNPLRPSEYLPPCSIFEGTLPDPVDISLEYLHLCRQFPDTATIQTIQTHIRHFIQFQW